MLQPQLFFVASELDLGLSGIQISEIFTLQIATQFSISNTVRLYVDKLHYASTYLFPQKFLHTFQYTHPKKKFSFHILKTLGRLLGRP